MKVLIILLTLVSLSFGQWNGWGGYQGWKSDGTDIYTYVVLYLYYTKGITKDASGLVTRWEDQSTYHNDFEATQSPVWSDSGLHFDGVNDFMKLVDTTTTDFDFTDGAGNDEPYTIMVLGFVAGSGIFISKSDYISPFP